MVRTDWYRRLNLPSLTEKAIRKEFVRTLIDSNRDHKFFVDWEKVKGSVSEHRHALTTLNSILTKVDRRAALKDTLLRDPSVIPVIPLLVAWRLHDDTGMVLSDDEHDGLKAIEYDFSSRSAISTAEAAKIADFCEASGLLGALEGLTDLLPYYMGVEVGMDTNARKNRSGKFMEDRIEPLAQDLARKHGWRLFRQRKFSSLKADGIDIPPGLKDRKFDLAFVRSDRKISVEINYFDQLGSKPQEVVDSYIQRGGESQRAGWEFVWVTDGPCWKVDPPQLQKGFGAMDAVLNLSFCKRGVLEAMLSPQ